MAVILSQRHEYRALDSGARMSNSKQEMIMKKSMMVVGLMMVKYNHFLPKGIKLIPVRWQPGAQIK